MKNLNADLAPVPFSCYLSPFGSSLLSKQENENCTADLNLNAIVVSRALDAVFGQEAAFGKT